MWPMCEQKTHWCKKWTQRVWQRTEKYWKCLLQTGAHKGYFDFQNQDQILKLEMWAAGEKYKISRREVVFPDKWHSCCVKCWKTHPIIEKKIKCNLCQLQATWFQQCVMRHRYGDELCGECLHENWFNLPVCCSRRRLLSTAGESSYTCTLLPSTGQKNRWQAAT